MNILCNLLAFVKILDLELGCCVFIWSILRSWVTYFAKFLLVYDRVELTHLM